MALDFAVLTADETSADIVPLEWDQHEALIDLAARFKLTQLLRRSQHPILLHRGDGVSAVAKR